ncbi:hypothetical protein [Pseudarthrobacter sp. MEB009]|uniref:hypothetical protein n=1 Tax=Pseudarthrobacter sp. MEB009 TaxID=3040326 RepID=UPI0025541239|nr:hypothetical protein [Pseudarthrobacter sp. MEB009]
MGKLGGLLAIATAALVLSGCAGAGEAQPESIPTTAGAQVLDSKELEQKRMAPFVATAPSMTATPDPAADASITEAEQDEFLAGVKRNWRGDQPDDSALVAMGNLACQRYDEGKAHTEVDVVPGGSQEAIDNSDVVAIFAGRQLCKEHNPDNL